MDSIDLHSRAASLVKRLAYECTRPSGIGSLSPSIYDTAWVAMVPKTVGGQTRWLYPESFQYLLDHQLPNGGWEAYAKDCDGILNSLAALLALKVHENSLDVVGCVPTNDIKARISRAIDFLGNQLENWDAKESLHVGFEILIPGLLELLEKHDVRFLFNGRSLLMALQQQKLAKFHPDFLHGEVKSTIVHSLEGFIDKVDFNRLSHHKISGSMMGSPSSTAAYLIYRSDWDYEAEAYLSASIASCRGNTVGGVPSAYPVTIFMLSWVIPVLLRGGFAVESLDSEHIQRIIRYLEYQKDTQNGLLGFAPYMLADADDTARTILSLNLLGRRTDPQHLISEFETKTHFKTYIAERNPSFSANCNVLDALINAPELDRCTSQILKVVTFLCDSWFDGQTNDKWNISTQYSMMLLAHALLSLLRQWDAGGLTNLPDTLVRHQLPIVLFQVLSQTVQTQNLNGSWGSPYSFEVTAYAVITLTSLVTLPWVTSIEPDVSTAINKGRSFLKHKAKDTPPEYLWIEKVTYGSDILSEAYYLAALGAEPSPQEWGESVKALTHIPLCTISKLLHFFSQLPLLSQDPAWKIRLSFIEGYLFLTRLVQLRLDVFPREKMAEDKYLEYIPFTWTCLNKQDNHRLTASQQWHMMVISMLNYQVDEYIEAVVGAGYQHNLEPVKQIVRNLCGFPGTSKSEVPKRNAGLGIDTGLRTPEESDRDKDADLDDVEKTLGRFVRSVLENPDVKRASSSDQLKLRQELQKYLLAQIANIEDNSRLAGRALSATAPAPLQNPGSSYYEWVTTTSADGVSCPYTFAYFACIVGSNGEDCFADVQQKYLAEAMCRHLATMCRQYNDYGSIARDRAEQNINSVDFPEFHDCQEMERRKESAGTKPCNGDVDDLDGLLRDELFEVAQIERAFLDLAMQKLAEKIPMALMSRWRIFANVVDLYGQIYVARDLTCRK